MKKMAKLLSAVLAVLMVLSCLPLTAMSAFALEPEISAVLNDATNLDTITPFELNGETIGTELGKAPTTSYYQ